MNHLVIKKTLEAEKKKKKKNHRKKKWQKAMKKRTKNESRLKEKQMEEGLSIHERNVHRFEFLKNAPVEADYVKDMEVQHKPFGKLLRNVKCFKCGKWGHSIDDRECSMNPHPLHYNEPKSKMYHKEVMEAGLKELNEQKPQIIVRYDGGNIDYNQNGAHSHLNDSDDHHKGDDDDDDDDEEDNHDNINEGSEHDNDKNNNNGEEEDEYEKNNKKLKSNLNLDKAIFSNREDPIVLMNKIKFNKNNDQESMSIFTLNTNLEDEEKANKFSIKIIENHIKDDEHLISSDDDDNNNNSDNDIDDELRFVKSLSIKDKIKLLKKNEKRRENRQKEKKK